MAVRKRPVLWPKDVHIKIGSLSWGLSFSGVIWISSESKLLPGRVKTCRQRPISVNLRSILSNRINFTCGISWVNRDHNFLPSTATRFSLSTEARITPPFYVYLFIFVWASYLCATSRFSLYTEFHSWLPFRIYFLVFLWDSYIRPRSLFNMFYFLNNSTKTNISN